VGLQPYPVKKKIVKKPPRNSAGFCGGGQGLSWAVEPRKGTISFSRISVSASLFGVSNVVCRVKGLKVLISPVSVLLSLLGHVLVSARSLTMDRIL
jgi:hypothetical protein